MISTYVKREPWESMRAKVDARKGSWTAEGTPDADRALIGELLRQVGAWEAADAFDSRCSMDHEAEVCDLRGKLRELRDQITAILGDD